MTTETPASQAVDEGLARELARVANTRRLLKRSIWALAVVFAGTMAILAGTVAESHRNARREAAIFASISAAAFRDGFCDRALRFAVAGLPPRRGGLPLSFQPRQLQGDLSFFASARNCYFRLALAGHTAAPLAGRVIARIAPMLQMPVAQLPPAPPSAEEQKAKS